MASLEVDLSNIQPGNTITVKWRGKPVFVRHRTEEEIGKAQGEDISHMRDPQSDEDRAQKPEVSNLLALLKHMFGAEVDVRADSQQLVASISVPAVKSCTPSCGQSAFL